MSLIDKLFWAKGEKIEGIEANASLDLTVKWIWDLSDDVKKRAAEAVGDVIIPNFK